MKRHVYQGELQGRYLLPYFRSFMLSLKNDRLVPHGLRRRDAAVFHGVRRRVCDSADFGVVCLRV